MRKLLPRSRRQVALTRRNSAHRSSRRRKPSSVEDINETIVVNQIIQAAVTSGEVDEMLSDGFVENSTMGEVHALLGIEIMNGPILTQTTAPRARETDSESNENLEYVDGTITTTTTQDASDTTANDSTSTV